MQVSVAYLYRDKRASCGFSDLSLVGRGGKGAASPRPAPGSGRWRSRFTPRGGRVPSDMRGPSGLRKFSSVPLDGQHLIEWQVTVCAPARRRRAARLRARALACAHAHVDRGTVTLRQPSRLASRAVLSSLVCHSTQVAPRSPTSRRTVSSWLRRPHSTPSSSARSWLAARRGCAPPSISMHRGQWRLVGRRVAAGRGTRGWTVNGPYPMCSLVQNIVLLNAPCDA